MENPWKMVQVLCIWNHLVDDDDSLPTRVPLGVFNPVSMPVDVRYRGGGVFNINAWLVLSGTKVHKKRLHH